EEDTAGLRTLRHLAYEKNAIDYVVFNFMTDSVSVVEGAKEVTTIRERDTVTITSSLWGAIMAAGLPFELAAEMEDIYQWSIDFFSIQKGDSFTVIYDRQMVDTVDVGLGRVWGAEFVQGGKSYYAIPFKQGEKIQYWDEQGNSLRKALLKAPLKYSRISSRFTYRRLHPVHRVYRAHTGVDYAAPSGTPVVAVADGVVVFKGWGGGGGNTLKIKHAGNLQSGYLHLRGFAKGIKQGSRVSQGEVIGYVGSTGTSTGPHLDFRLWRNGTPIDPLKVPSEPSEPIKKENIVPFEYVRERIMAELRGDSIAMEDMIVQLDSLPVQSQPVEEPVAEATKEEKK
ncbi:MAG: peptidoglycan DD-metalloendopeptidase family protein, partial [Rikenellaceae bacterium]|nr:peptidoglycan DD-metalloendopeptidase family protein [Rikenellaceae bacterium]